MTPNPIPAAASEFIARLPLAPLGKGPPLTAFRSELDALLPSLPPACRAGLLCACGFWDESHEVAQDIHTPDGGFWHAILHRREPDPFNSKYWFRQVGSHPVLAQLRERATGAGYDFTTAEAFVDFCERVRGTGSEGEEAAKRVQRLEWELLFGHCWRGGRNRSP